MGERRVQCAHIFRIAGGALTERITNSAKVLNILVAIDPTLAPELNMHISNMIGLWEECQQVRKATAVKSPGEQPDLVMPEKTYTGLTSAFVLRFTFLPDKEKYAGRFSMQQISMLEGSWPTQERYPYARLHTAEKPEPVKLVSDSSGRVRSIYEGADDIVFKDSADLKDRFVCKHLSVVIANVNVLATKDHQNGGYGTERGVVYWADLRSHDASEIRGLLDII